MGDRLFHYQEILPPGPKPIAVWLVTVEQRWGDDRALREIEALQLAAVSLEDAEGAEHLRQIAKWAKKARVGGWIERTDPSGRVRRCFCTSVKGHT